MADLEGDDGREVPTDEELFQGTAPAFGGENPEMQAAEEVFDLLGGSGEPEGAEPEEAGETDDAGVSGEDDPALGSEDGSEYDDEDFEVEADDYYESEEEYEEPAEGDEPEESEDVETSEADDGDFDWSEVKDQTITVEVDGEEQEVTLEEARHGYMRTSAFTRKTQELAEQRDQVREFAEQVRAEREQYADGLEQIEDVLEAVQPEKPDPSLRRSNPEEYARRMEEYEQRQEQIESVRAEREAAEEQNTEEARQARMRRLQEERELLEAAVPELTDPEKGPELQNQMVEVATEEYGFSPEELSAVEDHRALRLLYDAMRYRELEETGRKVTEETDDEPKKEKSETLKPGTSQGSKRKQKSRKSRGNKNARKRLAESGSVDDAASVIESLIE